MNKNVILPRELTAENGAKKLLSGEFHTIVECDCPECFGEGDNGDIDDVCEICEGVGTLTVKETIPWSTIKDIYKMIVENLGKDQNTQFNEETQPDSCNGIGLVPKPRKTSQEPSNFKDMGDMKEQDMNINHNQCDECENFPEIEENEDWKDKTSGIVMGRCKKGLTMQFKMPKGHPDMNDDWGFFKKKCRIFKEKVSHE